MLGIANAMSDAEYKIASKDVAEGMINEPGLSFNSLAEDDLVPKHWQTALSSVYLKDKLVLTPQLKHLNGYAASNYVSIYIIIYVMWSSNLNQMSSKWSLT